VPKRLSQNIEYLYFSERLAETIEAQQQGRLRGQVETSVDASAQPLGVGVRGRVSYKTGERAQTTSGARRAESLRALLADLTVEGFDPNGVADFVHGESDTWWGSWFVKDEGLQDTQIAYFGSAYTMESGERVLACLFGSKTNLLGYFGDVQESRLFGWAASTVFGVETLLKLSRPRDADATIHSDEDKAFKLLGRNDDDDLVDTAAAIVVEQGITGDGSEESTYWPRNRGYTIGEGNLEWLARAYIWQTDIELYRGKQCFNTVFVGAPIWVRTGSGQPLGKF
jgi:hypothetical protein